MVGKLLLKRTRSDHVRPTRLGEVEVLDKGSVDFFCILSCLLGAFLRYLVETTNVFQA